MITVRDMKKWLENVDDDYIVTIDNNEFFNLETVIGSKVNITGDFYDMNDYIYSIKRNLEIASSYIDGIIDGDKNCDIRDDLRNASSYLHDAIEYIEEFEVDFRIKK